MPLSAKAVANYFLELAEKASDHSLSPMKLQKLVYFAHGWNLALSGGTPLILEDIEAWPYGPVIPALYHEFKHFGNGEITSLATELEWTSAFEMSVSTPTVPADSEACDLLNKVWEVYRRYTPIQLSNATHEPNTPWDKINRKYNGDIPRKTVIPIGLIQEYFETLAANQAVRS